MQLMLVPPVVLSGLMQYWHSAPWQSLCDCADIHHLFMIYYWSILSFTIFYDYCHYHHLFKLLCIFFCASYKLCYLVWMFAIFDLITRALILYNHLFPIVVEHFDSIDWRLLVQKWLQHHQLSFWSWFVNNHRRHSISVIMNWRSNHIYDEHCVRTLCITSNIHFCSVRESRRRIT